MSSRLINVRLDSERLRKAQALRQQGVTLSDVVRVAIDHRFQQCCAQPRPDARTLIDTIFEQHPDPPGLPPRDYDVHDREAARKAVLRKLLPSRL